MVARCSPRPIPKGLVLVIIVSIDPRSIAESSRGDESHENPKPQRVMLSPEHPGPLATPNSPQTLNTCSGQCKRSTHSRPTRSSHGGSEFALDAAEFKVLGWFRASTSYLSDKYISRFVGSVQQSPIMEDHGGNGTEDPELERGPRSSVYWGRKLPQTEENLRWSLI